MATLAGTLRDLFSRTIVVRKHRGQIRNFDIHKVQMVGTFQHSGVKGKFKRGGSHLGMGYGWPINAYPEIESKRQKMYIDYEQMDRDAIISSALDIYADECTTKNDEGDVLKIKTDDAELQAILFNLFYDVLDIDFNLWAWVRTACKYGNCMLGLEIHDKIGVVSAIPIHPSLLRREEGYDRENPERIRYVFEGTHTPGITKMYYEAFEIIDIRLISDTNYIPYGKSVIEGARQEYKKLTLMEDAMLIHRIMRAPERRIFKIDVGAIPPDEVEAYVDEIANELKKEPYIDPTTGEYNLRFNIMNAIEDYFLPVRGSDSGTDISTLDGLGNEGHIDDIEYIRNKMMAYLKIPKAFLGYEGEITGKAVLAAEDIRFARTIERIQKFIIAEFYKIALIHLSVHGYDSETIANFELELNNPSMIYMRQRVDLMNEQMNLVQAIKENNVFGDDYIYKKIFNMTQEEIDANEQDIIKSKKLAFRIEQIGTEGNDPEITGKSFGTAHDIASMHMASKGAGGGSGDDVKKLYSDDDRENNEGRPEKAGSYGRHKDQTFGRDPVGDKEATTTAGETRRGNIHKQMINEKRSAVAETYKINKPAIQELLESLQKDDFE